MFALPLLLSLSLTREYLTSHCVPTTYTYCFRPPSTFIPLGPAGYLRATTTGFLSEHIYLSRHLAFTHIHTHTLPLSPQPFISFLSPTEPSPNHSAYKESAVRRQAEGAILVPFDLPPFLTYTGPTCCRSPFTPEPTYLAYHIPTRLRDQQPQVYQDDSLLYPRMCYKATLPSKQGIRHDQLANSGQPGLPAPGSRDGAVHAARHPASLQPPPKNLHVCQTQRGKRENS